jgi:hypothetical protein
MNLALPVTFSTHGIAVPRRKVLGLGKGPRRTGCIAEVTLPHVEADCRM